ncbi:hypothetical protein L195_g051616, partial [Trifolium pratense]
TNGTPFDIEFEKEVCVFSCQGIIIDGDNCCVPGIQWHDRSDDNDDTGDHHDDDAGNDHDFDDEAYM